MLAQHNVLVPGKEDFVVRMMDRTYRLSSAEAKRAFEINPAAFVHLPGQQHHRKRREAGSEGQQAKEEKVDSDSGALAKVFQGIDDLQYSDAAPKLPPPRLAVLLPRATGGEEALQALTKEFRVSIVAVDTAAKDTE